MKQKLHERAQEIAGIITEVQEEIPKGVKNLSKEVNSSIETIKKNKLKRLIREEIQQYLNESNKNKEDFEITIPVYDYYDASSQDEEMAFEDASNAEKDVIKEMNFEIKAFGKKTKTKGWKKLKVVGAKFLEFDSENVTHAGAIFNATVTGPSEVIEALKNWIYYNISDI